MEALPCRSCKALCCGPVPISAPELKRIKKKIQSMPAKLRATLQNQVRYFGTCIFLDMDNHQCGIYSARPDVCQAFGYHRNLVCAFQPESAAKREWETDEKPIGVLSVDYTWKDFT